MATILVLGSWADLAYEMQYRRLQYPESVNIMVGLNACAVENIDDTIQPVIAARGTSAQGMRLSNFLTESPYSSVGHREGVWPIIRQFARAHRSLDVSNSHENLLGNFLNA